MKISQNGLNLIKQFEGCRLEAYKAVASETYYTIGYGHYGPDVKKTMIISQAQADRYLEQDIVKFEKYVNEIVKLSLNQNQFDALISFTYNCGAGNLKKLVEGRNLTQIADALLLYTHSGGKELPGLVKRRKAERELFIKRDVKIIIGSARIDEKGKTSGGAAGDQKQKASPDYSGEVSMQDFYVSKKGWVVLRAKDPEIAEKIAAAMKQACNNPNVGYNQLNRGEVIKYGTASSKKCGCDCTSLLRQCIIEASGKDPGNFTTANESTYLVSSGMFEKIEYTSNMNLFIGDVLVTKTKGHTVVVVEGNSRINLAKNDKVESTGGNAMNKLTIQIPTIRKGSKGKAVRILQALLYINVTGEFDQNTESSCKAFQNKMKLVSDGICGPKTWEEVLKDL